MKLAVFGSLWAVRTGGQPGDEFPPAPSVLEAVLDHGYLGVCALALAARLRAHRAVEFSPRNGWNVAGFVALRIRYVCCAMVGGERVADHA